MIIFVTDLVENKVGKGENAGYQHFLHFRQCFQKASFAGSLKVGILRSRVKSCYLGYFRCTKGNPSHHFGFDWRACFNGTWNSESGFPQYNGNIRDNTIENPIFRVGYLKSLFRLIICPNKALERFILPSPLIFFSAMFI